MFFGFQLFGELPFLDIMILDENWKFYNRKLNDGDSYQSSWNDLKYKSPMINSTLRGIPIRTPSKEETQEHLLKTYGSDYMTKLYVMNHKFKPNPKVIIDLKEKDKRSLSSVRGRTNRSR